MREKITQDLKDAMKAGDRAITVLDAQDAIVHVAWFEGQGFRDSQATSPDGGDQSAVPQRD